MRTIRTDTLVIGSGPGGSVTALTLAAAGREVLLVEEGGRHGLADYGRPAPEAMRLLYRRNGMTAILGGTPLGYVEGRCVGGSSEINCGFWQRSTREVLLDWNARYGLREVTPEDLAPHYAWAEEMLGVTRAPAWPASTRVFARGVEAMGLTGIEVPRVAPGCANRNACGSGCPTGAKRSMSRVLIPAAESAGARVQADTRALRLVRDGRRIVAAIVRVKGPDGAAETVRVEAADFFVCAGATETPSLLRRSGIRRRVGNSLNVHPMLKVAALFDEDINALESALPLIQVHGVLPEITLLGGAFFSLGHLALLLSENWPDHPGLIRQHRRIASYFIAVKGSGWGGVRPTPLDPDSSMIFYQLSKTNLAVLSQGLARLATMLLAGGAREVHPCVHGVPVIRRESEAMRWMDRTLPGSSLSLTTVHAFSTCPIGENRRRCAADSFGLVFDLDNLRVNDASMLPDSPGTNPQATIMAVARRNALRFLEQRR